MNIDRRLAGGQIGGHLQDALAANQVSADRIVIEITESVMAEPECRALLRDLRTKGSMIAVDDFGTGYSSLAMLGRFDVDIIKIDKTFLAWTVVEGVETTSMYARLVRRGGLLLQGYAIARPMELPAAHLLCAHAETTRRSAKTGGHGMELADALQPFG